MPTGTMITYLERHYNEFKKKLIYILWTHLLHGQNYIYKPGGTAIINNRKITNQIKEKENYYPLGRWSTIKVCPQNFEISIITAYTVCNTQIASNKDKTAAH